MSWNKERYEKVKKDVAYNIAKGYKKASFYMMEYKKMIIEEDYEAAKAITEVLKPLNYDTADTHQHIKRLSD